MTLYVYLVDKLLSPQVSSQQNWMTVQQRSVLDMASFWLWCLLINFVSFRNHPSTADVSETDFGLQLPGNGTSCPQGDPLHGLCDQWGMSCCLWSQSGPGCGPGMCLVVEGGDENSIGTVLSQLPVENITLFGIQTPVLSADMDLRSANVCLLSNLQILNIYYITPSDMEVINCLPQLRQFLLFDDIYSHLTITNSTFHGLDHLWFVFIQISSISLSAIAMMQLVNSTKESLDIRVYAHIELLDVWPLCLAQKQQHLHVRLDYNRIFDFQNTLIPALCNIEDTVQADVEISLSQNAISHVSDIASGWGFDSLRHFIIKLIRKNSTIFPILLEGNPFVCDCMDLELYQMLRDPGYKTYLTNLAGLICEHPHNLKGRRFDRLLEGSDLNCDSPSLSIILGVSIGGAVVLAVSVVGFLFYNRIRLYRWSGYALHPWDLDECDGEDKEFDVFVSHASEDEPWTQDLIEELESHGFKVLFHQRDFEVGITKIDNITKAVSKSKRTICILWPSFVASPWCSWEFITVFNDDIEEHTRRLLLIVKERVAWESLSLAMQRYMRDFTYIDAESPYFMDNLLYSLPVKRLGEGREMGAGETEDSRNCQPVPSQSGHSVQNTEQTPLLQNV